MTIPSLHDYVFPSYTFPNRCRILVYCSSPLLFFYFSIKTKLSGQLPFKEKKKKIAWQVDFLSVQTINDRIMVTCIYISSWRSIPAQHIAEGPKSCSHRVLLYMVTVSFPQKTSPPIPLHRPRFENSGSRPISKTHLTRSSDEPHPCHTDP